MKRKEVLTTGEVAKICHVAPRTVSKWFDTGQLRGYRIPGSRDRRIPLPQLIQFMKVHGMPLEGLEGSTTRVLIVDPDAAAGAVAESLANEGRYEVRVAANDFEAGMRAERFGPHVILVDVLADGIDAGEILANLRANPDLAATRVVAVAGALTAGQRRSLIQNGYDSAVSKPYRIDELIGAVEEATNLVA